MPKNEENEDEIEVTEAMADAGVRAMFARENDEMFAAPEVQVAAIYRVMARLDVGCRSERGCSEP